MFVLAGWQDDDLPQFAEIHDILVINNVCFLHLHDYTTAGIDRHVHSYVIKRTENEELLALFELNGHPPTVAHFNANTIYVTLRSQVVRVVCTHLRPADVTSKDCNYQSYVHIVY